MPYLPVHTTATHSCRAHVARLYLPAVRAAFLLPPRRYAFAALLPRTCAPHLFSTAFTARTAHTRTRFCISARFARCFACAYLPLHAPRARLFTTPRHAACGPAPAAYQSSSRIKTPSPSPTDRLCLAPHHCLLRNNRRWRCIPHAASRDAVRGYRWHACRGLPAFAHTSWCHSRVTPFLQRAHGFRFHAVWMVVSRARLPISTALATTRAAHRLARRLLPANAGPAGAYAPLQAHRITSSPIRHFLSTAPLTAHGRSYISPFHSTCCHLPDPLHHPFLRTSRAVVRAFCCYLSWVFLTRIARVPRHTASFTPTTCRRSFSHLQTYWWRLLCTCTSASHYWCASPFGGRTLRFIACSIPLLSTGCLVLRLIHGTFLGRGTS